MKKFLLVTALCLLTTVGMKAQDVFKELLNNAKAVAEDRSKDIETRKIATFKYDELTYMAMKVREEVLRDTTDLVFFNKMMTQMNEQSYAMHEFLQLFLTRLAKSKKKEERDVVMALFRDASINHPMFNDMDKELILAYYQNDNYLTQFSLDTNWVAALEAVTGKKE